MAQTAPLFGRRLQGDFHASPPAALHRPAALFAEYEALLVLFYANSNINKSHHIMFFPFVNGKVPVFLENPEENSPCRIPGFTGSR